MKNLKISQKLIVSFLIVAALTLITGIVGIFGMTSITTNMEKIYNDNLLSIKYIGDMRGNFQLGRASLYGAIVNTGNNAAQQESLTAAFKTLDEALANYNGLSVDNTENAMRVALNDIYKKYQPYLKNTQQALKDGKPAEEVLALTSEGAAISTELTADLNKLAQYNDDGAASSKADASSTASMLLVVQIIVIIAAVAVAILMAIWISGMISKPLVFMATALTQVGNTGNLNFSDADWATAQKFGVGKDETAQAIAAFGGTLKQLIYYGESVQTVANQDLTVDIKTLSSEDTIGNALVKMIGDLNNAFGDINSATEQVSDGAKQISDSAQSLAQGSTEQAAAVQQLSSSISEVAEKTKNNAQEAKHAAELSDAVRSNAEKGSSQMNAMIQAVQAINDASQDIQKVIKVIDDLAFQTNILALNAAVEAARAGSAGKGFAVVAEEVRSLAGKSADAAKDTSALIENSMSKAELGAKIAAETSASLNEIVSGIQETTTIVETIAKASEEQTSTIGQINVGIDQVAQVVQQNSATSQESAATAEELSSQSTVLDSLVAQFKLKDSDRLLAGNRQLRLK